MFIKKIISIIFIAILTGFIANQAYSQGSSVNETGEPADSSAMLDVSAADKGMLIPRMTIAERDLINNPANGLMIYNTEENRLEIYNGTTSSWHYYSNTLVSIPSFICGEKFVDSRDGQSYATTQIGDQCWMAENLNVGIKIQGSTEMTDNGIIEKYCYVNSNCDRYGGLYQWDEMMQYTTLEGSQGICPEGWHLPTDEEWCVLEDWVSYNNVICPGGYGSGTEAGTNLKSIYGWYGGQNGFDLYGFNALPGGRRDNDASWPYLPYEGHFWTSSENGSTANYLRLVYDDSFIVPSFDVKIVGLSVRCLKD